MPALSQNFIFTIPNGDSSYQSVQVNYPNTGTSALIYESDKLKGDGYFGGSDGLHTVSWNISNFIGTVEVQGSLSSNPQATDWSTVILTSPSNYYSVDTTGLVRPIGLSATNYTTVTTAVTSYNFTGNFVWLRGRISNFTEGVVNSISINR
jgi:hypothetical protein